MSIHYRVHARPNPQNRTAPAKYYATSVVNGTTDLDALADTISQQCSVTPSDCYAVLIALETNMMQELREGKSVKLGRIGSFRVSVISEGKDTAAAVTPAAMKQRKIIFKPAQAMQQMLQKLSFKKIK
ncbi:DNA-binding protein, histone-like, putative [Pustulibacterium marinum]|uniref:DNA-binding protein, histone-like, putative n=1 Tax=Pustulibacterium marinum TaxID=1224947 RepID=A0A1I7HMK5_9FLAO|nr:HU family DNA-binding protein [Pustulibacterium marinum]SFU61955.1 DNA-binding protein, histone-like, putative [Pustulibacterium marinum]